MRTMTKKTLLIAAMLSFALCGYAQKGERGIGVSCAVKYPTIEKDYSGIGVELKYMKYLTDKLRMLPYANIDYSESSDDLYAYFGVDFHRFCYDSNVWNPYFIAGLHIGGDSGLGGGNWKIGGGTGSVSTGTSTTIQIEERCRLCAGTGICTTCNGRGQIINWNTGQYQDCPNCHAPLEGKCHSCSGTGRK